MKKGILLITSIFVFTSINIKAQDAKLQEEFKPSGSPTAKIFFNLHHDFDESSAFEIQRVYFGYKYKMSETFSANVLFDVGSPEVNIGDSLKGTTSQDFTAYIKNAAMQYSKGNLTIDAGVIGLKQLSVQESYWGHRYIYKSFIDYAKMGTTADLGASIDYKFFEKFSADLTVRNGEGYKSTQDDNAYRTSLGLSFIPIKGLIIRGVYDYIEKTEAQYTIAHFIGYKNEKILVGGEYNYQTNSDSKKDHTLSGFSFYGSYNITKKFQVFGRYDNLTSEKLEGATDNWNIKNDGSLIIAGVQYKPIKNIDIAVDYQGWLADKEDSDKNMIYINLQVSF